MDTNFKITMNILSILNGIDGVEIIKPITLNQWQTVTFNFATDSYINLDPNSPDPIHSLDHRGTKYR